VDDLVVVWDCAAANRGLRGVVVAAGAALGPVEAHFLRTAVALVYVLAPILCGPLDGAVRGCRVRNRGGWVCPQPTVCSRERHLYRWDGSCYAYAGVGGPSCAN
jgi:hypothetical protein